MTPEAIKKFILEAFPREPLPRKYGEGANSDIVNIHYPGKIWTEITWNYISMATPGIPDEHFSSMSGEAKAYYLPAFMFVCLSTGHDQLDVTYDFFIWKITEPQKLNDLTKRDIFYLNEKFYGLTSRLTPEQKSAVAAFLKHQITHLGPEPIDYINEDAKAAYDSYWYQFDPEQAAPT
jgi:hypothetical protein